MKDYDELVQRLRFNLLHGYMTSPTDTGQAADAITELQRDAARYRDALNVIASGYVAALEDNEVAGHYRDIAGAALKDAP